MVDQSRELRVRMACMDDLTQQQISSEAAAMIRHRRRVAHARTPEQQMEISRGLEVEAMEAIGRDPVARQAFLARNYRKRRSDRVAQLEDEMMRRCDE